MNMAITFFVGCVTFVLVMIVKIPVKKLTALIANRIAIEDDEEYVLYKRLNVVLILLAILLAMASYYWVMLVLELEHIKWCCSIKAGAIAIAIYAVYELLLSDQEDGIKDKGTNDD